MAAGTIFLFGALTNLLNKICPQAALGEILSLPGFN